MKQMYNTGKTKTTGEDYMMKQLYDTDDNDSILYQIQNKEEK